MTTAVDPRVRFDPAASSWGDLLRARWTRVTPAALGARRELGLPTDRPIVMTGHQATFWHAGILSKYLAAGALQSRTGAACAWLVVDQDEAEFDSLRVPVMDASGRLHALTLALTKPAEDGTPACGVPTFDPLPPDYRGLTPALASVGDGVERIRAALAARRGERDGARQVSLAAFDLLGELNHGATVIMATQLAQSPAFLGIAERLRTEAASAVESYNLAAASVPRARLASLHADAARGRFELPLWLLRAGSPRLRVTTETRAGAADLVAPRALLMTAMARLLLCDLFIHGTGGGVYDLATERWMERWLGASLAPTVVATADLRLPIKGPEVTPEQIARATWEAHYARHHPEVIGRADLEAEKRVLVERIAEDRRAGRDPLPSYRALQSMLERYRAACGTELRTRAERAQTMRTMGDEAAVAHDRTWSFALYDTGALIALDEKVRHALGTV